MLEAKSYYREASAKGPKEDGSVINNAKRLYIVSDGVSGPFSPSHPVLKYNDLTGGQMVSQTICNRASISPLSFNVQDVLLDANKAVLANHLLACKDPTKEAVAGASVAACQVGRKEVAMILIGDCFILYKNRGGFHFFTNDDQAAFDLEKKGNEIFARDLEKAEGDMDRAWDLHFPYLLKRQFFRANRNIGQGGHAALNGDPALKDCWTFCIVYNLEWILLGSDGLLPAASTDPKNRDRLALQLGYMYEKGGIEAIIEWRDKEDILPHIGAGNHPEATAIELKFK